MIWKIAVSYLLSKNSRNICERVHFLSKVAAQSSAMLLNINPFPSDLPTGAELLHNFTAFDRTSTFVNHFSMVACFICLISFTFFYYDQKIQNFSLKFFPEIVLNNRYHCISSDFLYFN